MIIYISLVLFLLTQAFISSSQVTYNFSQNTQVKYSESGTPVFDIEGEYLYIYDESVQSYSRNSDTIVILKQRLQSDTQFAIKIDVPNLPAMIADPIPMDMRVCGNSLVLLFHRAFLVFSLKENKIKAIQPQSQSYSYLLESESDSIIYFAKNYNYNKYDQRIKCMTSAYNLKELKFFADGNVIPGVTGIGFTHFGKNKWFAILDTFVVFAKSVERELLFYNAYGVLIDSFYTKNDKGKVKINLEVHDSILTSYGNNAKELIQHLLPLHKKFARIEKILSINDSTLLIFSIPENLGNKEVRTLDVLTIRDNKINFERNYWTDRKPKLLGKVKRDNYPLFSFYSTSIKTEGGKIYCIYPDIPRDILGMSYEKLQIKRKAYFLKNLPVYQLVEYEVK